ncbi:hypothetical protein [Hymenobacter properus]|uniref:Nucleotide-diphospho-sugar transferase domain-containing protein n=1 Tax=Hymenobacter properus TaxID=2791026 RepID=A0A931FJY8_9BACT|nr:hypothetical protein [Hymenobacter properus]MBF9143442.1 hypothetical protein [Hymenobacter properus]MBR7722255.1 hypothetical protein [Microvirga sp. SRT04]
MTNLVILSYGSRNEYRRAVFAVLSFFSYYEADEPLPPVRVLLFTDRTDYFSQYLGHLPVEYVILTPEQQTEMMGTVGYRHRIKAVVVGDVLRQHPTNNLLFFDSDTFFTRHPGPLLASIKPGFSVMHTVEFTFEDNAHMALPGSKTVRDFITALEAHPFHTSRGEERFVGTQQCWNSGVLGLAPSVIPYLPDVYQLIDYLYAASHWHIIEQIAFSLILQTRDTILPAEDYVYHYWEGSKKMAADALLAHTFDHGFVSLPAPAQRAKVQQLVAQLPTAIPAYLAEHREIGLKEHAINSFNAGQYAAGYRAALGYLMKCPNDRKFWRDVLYHTKKKFK